MWKDKKYYRLQKKDKLFGNKDRIINQEIYEILPEVSKNKFKANFESKIPRPNASPMETILNSINLGGGQLNYLPNTPENSFIIDIDEEDDDF